MSILLKNGICLLLLLMAGIAYAANNNDKPVVSDPSKPILVKSGSPVVKIIIASNPTTGYSWFLQNYDDKLITPICHEYIAPMAKMPGAGGYEEWIFKVNNDAFIVPHLMSISLVYTRPWEMKNMRTVNFKIVTQEAVAIK